MSYSSRVRVDGNNITVVYAAAQLPVSTGIGPWQKSREVRRHLTRTRTRYCFVAARGGEGIEVWWSAEERGVSIAASLDNWYSTILSKDEETLDDFVVIIPFDTNVYLAEIANGLVKTERVVDENSALEQLERYRVENRVMRGFAAGGRIDPGEQYVELEPLPFDLRCNRFERAFAVLLRNRLYHPMVIAPVLALFAVSTLSQVDWLRLRDWMMKYNQPAPDQQQQPVIPVVSHAGGATLLELVKFIWSLDVLYGDGLRQLEFMHPSTVVLSGQSSGYPSRTKAFADQRHGQFRWNSAGWAVVIDIAMPDTVPGTPMRTGVLLENMSRGWPTLDLVEGPVAGHTEITRFNVNQTDINTFDLVDIAQRLDGYPARISHLSCSYTDFSMSGCEISIETRTL